MPTKIFFTWINNKLFTTRRFNGVEYYIKHFFSNHDALLHEAKRKDFHDGTNFETELREFLNDTSPLFSLFDEVEKLWKVFGNTHVVFDVESANFMLLCSHDYHDYKKSNFNDIQNKIINLLSQHNLTNRVTFTSR